VTATFTNTSTATPAATPAADPNGLTKTLVDTNAIHTSDTDVAIGEILTYRISVVIPAGGSYANAVVEDILDRGLAFVGCVSITPANGLTASAGTLAGVCANPNVSAYPSAADQRDLGRRVRFEFGTLANNPSGNVTLNITYTAVVLDSAGNVDGLTLDNNAVLRWDGGMLRAAPRAVEVVEPELQATMTVSRAFVAPGERVTFTIRVYQTSESTAGAFDLVINDPLPTALQFVPGTLSCRIGAQEADICRYDSATHAIRAVWHSFTLSGGDGAIQFNAIVPADVQTGTRITNLSNMAWTSLPIDPAPLTGEPIQQSAYNHLSTERGFDSANGVDLYGASASAELNVVSLPQTGFAPGRETKLGNVPAGAYAKTGNMTIEIPRLGVDIPIVGVPFTHGTWNVAWLGNQAGYLEGTAFPTWSGNSVITGHDYLPSGLPGPFVNIGTLEWGDEIIVHAFGQDYIFEVRGVSYIEPNDTALAFRHEVLPWLTLLTCREYDEESNAYRLRVVIQAVLVEIK